MTTIRRQLTWKLLVAFAVPLVIGGAIAYALIRDEMIEQFDSALAAQAAAIGAVTRMQPDGTVDLSGSAAVMRDYAEPQEGAADDDETPPVFQIRRLDGSTLARSASLRTADLAMAIMPRDEPRFWNLVLPSGMPGRAVGLRFRSHPAASSAAAPADLLIVSAVDRRDLDRTVDSLAWLLAGTASVLLLATFVVVPRVVRTEFAPIEALADQAGRITADSLETRFSTTDLPGELEPIGRRLNDLLSRLETSFERERRFSADVAHELRTPLAELRTLAELAMKWPESRPVETDRDVLAIATQMESLVTRLLSMIRSDQGRVPVSVEAVNLGGLLQEVWKGLEPRAMARQLRLTWDVPASQDVGTDRVLLRSILVNVLQNAVEYAPVGGAIAITTRIDDTGFDLRVRNDAGALSADDVTRLFDRFWRQDASRSGADHAGLGLPLARSFAQALGGTLTAEFGADRQLTIALACPGSALNDAGRPQRQEIDAQTMTVSR